MRFDRPNASPPLPSRQRPDWERSHIPGAGRERRRQAAGCSAYTSRVYSRLMSVPLTLLGLLEREPSHGYDLKRDYDTFFSRGKPLSFGQVYATLGRLARDGKVVISEVGPGEGPDRKRYVITERGATEVQTWLAD